MDCRVKPGNDDKVLAQLAPHPGYELWHRAATLRGQGGEHD
jgi:hypothetical protein